MKGLQASERGKLVLGRWLFTEKAPYATGGK